MFHFCFEHFRTVPGSRLLCIYCLEMEHSHSPQNRSFILNVDAFGYCMHLHGKFALECSSIKVHLCNQGNPKFPGSHTMLRVRG